MTNDTADASARAPRGSSGLPAGIIKARKKYQARLSYVPTGCTKKEMRPIGTFDTVAEAVAALAVAQATVENVIMPDGMGAQIVAAFEAAMADN